MSEIVHVQIGGCGNRIGNNFWDSINEEHGINLHGACVADHGHNNVYYQERGDGSCAPRAILADLDPESMAGDQHRSYFDVDKTVLGLSSARGNWACGMYAEGCEVIDALLDCVRRETEACECLQGFQIMHSLGGGTGSGLGSLFMSKLREEYSDRVISTFSVIPSRKVSDFPVEPYNAVFALHYLIKDADMCFTLDNETLYDDTCASGVVTNPSHAELNSIINVAICNATRSLRFPGGLHDDLRKLAVKMVPFPRLHFLTMGYAPLWYATKKHPVLCFDRDMGPTSGQDNGIFDIMCTAGSYQGRYLASTCTLHDNANMGHMDQSDFLNCSTTYTTPSASNPPESGISSFIGNNMAIKEVWKRVYGEFRGMYSRKAFLSCYISEGMDEGEVVEAQDSLRDLIAEYELHAGAVI